MHQKEYAVSPKTHTCPSGLHCCKTHYGPPRDAKPRMRRHVRRVTKFTTKQGLDELQAEMQAEMDELFAMECQMGFHTTLVDQIAMEDYLNDFGGEW